MARRDRRSVSEWLDDAERAESQVDHSWPWWMQLAVISAIVTGFILNGAL
jgi:hypothetical protein